MVSKGLSPVAFDSALSSTFPFNWFARRTTSARDRWERDPGRDDGNWTTAPGVNKLRSTTKAEKLRDWEETHLYRLR